VWRWLMRLICKLLELRPQYAHYIHNVNVRSWMLFLDDSGGLRWDPQVSRLAKK
jgi:hypothetical protein